GTCCHEFGWAGQDPNCWWSPSTGSQEFEAPNGAVDTNLLTRTQTDFNTDFQGYFRALSDAHRRQPLLFMRGRSCRSWSRGSGCWMLRVRRVELWSPISGRLVGPVEKRAVDTRWRKRVAVFQSVLREGKPAGKALASSAQSHLGNMHSHAASACSHRNAWVRLSQIWRVCRCLVVLYLQKCCFLARVLARGDWSKQTWPAAKYTGSTGYLWQALSGPGANRWLGRAVEN
ncbi:unnamed protein product, partial [Protopolystoma xenopodis]